MDLYNNIRCLPPIQFLTSTDSAITKPSFAGVIVRYVFLVTVYSSITKQTQKNCLDHHRGWVGQDKSLINAPTVW